MLGAGGLVILTRATGAPGRTLALPKVRFQARVIGAEDAPLGAVVAAINADGTIVGSLTTEAGMAAFAHRGTALRLLTGEGQISAARAVNGRDAIAGAVAGRAVVWRDDAVIALDTLGGETGEAFGINDDGLSVGQAATADGRTHAVLWQRGGTARDLSADDVALSVAYGINADGIAVGYTAVGGTGRTERAARWVEGELVDLGTLGGDVSQATAINAGGVVVGSSGTAPGFGSVDHAVIWDGPESTEPTDLGVLGKAKVPGRESEIVFDQSQARAINAEGWVVGYGASSAENAPHSLATIWLEGRITAPYDLNLLIGDAAKDLVLTRASGVNDAGTIVCTGFERGDEDRVSRVVVLTRR